MSGVLGPDAGDRGVGESGAGAGPVDDREAERGQGMHGVDPHPHREDLRAGPDPRQCGLGELARTEDPGDHHAPGVHPDVVDTFHHLPRRDE